MSSRPEKDADKPLTPRQAWQPFTPRGVAAFAQASLTRLLIAQLIVAALVATAVVWFFSIAWFPVLDEAIRRLPDTGHIRRATLNFGGASPVRLAENSRLALVVDLERAGTAGSVADLEVTFEKTTVAVCGAVGCWRRPYEDGFLIQFNRPEVEPAWGAWRGPALGLAALLTVASMFAMWWPLALLYSPLVRFVAFYGDRTVSWRGAWRMSAAALLPGALLVALATILYGFGVVDLTRAALLFALHGVAGLLFVLTSPLFLPRISRAGIAKNPFAPSAK